MSNPIHKDTLHFITTDVDVRHTPRKPRPHDFYDALLPGNDKVRCVAVSDTHSHPDWKSRIPPGDVFIHCGDLTRAGTRDQILTCYEQIKSLPHTYKIVIAGNHDLGLDQHFVKRHAQALEQHDTQLTSEESERLQSLWKSTEARSAGIYFLEHEYVTLEVREKKIHFFGSPYTPEFFHWAFMYPLDKDIWSPISPSHPSSSYPSPSSSSDKFQLPLMPHAPVRKDEDKVIWITHGPAKGVLDSVVGVGPVGCPFLSDAIARDCPDVHFFGHIHEGAAEGLYLRRHSEQRQTQCVNAALLDEQYRLAYPAVVIDL